MNEQEPGPWELQRTLNRLATDLKDGLEGLNRRLDGMVSVGVHEAQMGRVEDRMKELADDIAQERSERQKALQDLAAQMEKSTRSLDEQMARTGMWLRWIAASVVLPIALLIGNIVLAGGQP